MRCSRPTVSGSIRTSTCGFRCSATSWRSSSFPMSATCRTRSAADPPTVVGALASGLLSFAYLYTISIHNTPLAIVMALLMWGFAYQGFNAVFPSFYPELFRTRNRVTGVAIGHNIGITIAALLPAVFVAVAPPRVGQYSAHDRCHHFCGDDHRGGRSSDRTRNLPHPPERSGQARGHAGQPAGISADKGADFVRRKTGQSEAVNGVVRKFKISRRMKQNRGLPSAAWRCGLWM